MVKQYTIGGSLLEDDKTYVKREADEQLYNALKIGQFCYVLNSRQTGKSSLRVQTMRQLRADYIACVPIDLSSGEIQSVTSEEWYVDQLYTMIESLELNIDLEEWWEQYQLASNLKKFRKFIEEVLLVQVKENIVIFIDEIDSVLSLKFPTDDFFSFIRSCHNQRADNSEYKRLTFCLLGVAAPNDLIEDKNRTPFNIGQSINLKGFQINEVNPLIKGLEAAKFSNPPQVMKEILYWTGGQPFLTQKLCQFMVEESEKENPSSVEQVVQSKIIQNWEHQDDPEHLRTIRTRLLKNEERTFRLLDLYQEILFNGYIQADKSYEQTQLKLSGLVVNENGKLKVYNPIYREVFNEIWIETQLEQLRPVWYREKKTAWEESNDQDYSCLLYGEELRLALEKDYSRLSQKDNQFINRSEVEYRVTMAKLNQKFANPELIINELIAWTKRQNQLLPKLIELVNTNSTYPPQGAEDKWVENLVRSHIIKNWQEIEILKEIDEKIKEKDEQQCFWLLVTYGKILEQGKEERSGSLEEQQLLYIGLVIKRPHYLKIANRIYENVFNQGYIEDMLPNIREYWGKLALWLIKNNDEYLLSPEELESTLKSLGHQNLELEEHQFLIRSRILNSRVA